MSNRLRYFYEFGDFRFDPESKVLYKEGESVMLPPKATEVLAILIDERGTLVEREMLLNTVWADTFVEDGNLNNAVSTLRKALGGNGVIQTVSRRGYRFTADVSRVAEEEIEEIVFEKRTVLQTTILSEVDGAAALNPAVNRNYMHWVLAGIIGSFVVAAGAFMLRTPTNIQPVASAPKKTIAVLPLKIVGNTDSKNDDPVASGIVENLATRLGGLRDLTVLSTRSSANLAATEADPIMLGRKLGADAVIEGSYQASGDRVHMIVRMINVADGSQLWSGSFDEILDDVLRLQDSLAAAAANKLSVRLNEEEKRRLERATTEDVEAYKLYLRGRYEWGKRTASGLQQSMTAFRQAIDRDPSFALAYAGLADTYALFADYSMSRPTEAFPKAKAAALRALEIDPDLARPRVTLAYILATFDWDYPEAERQYKMAIEAEPNYATTHQWYGEMLCALHRFDEAEKELNKAVELDPLVPITLSERAVLHYYKGELDEALGRFSALKTDHPKFPTSYIFSAWIYGLKGDLNNAFENEIAYKKLQGTDAASLSELSDAFSRGGHKAFLMKIAELNVREVEKGAFPGYKVPHTFARLGNREETIRWIEKCIEEHSPSIIKMHSDSNFDFVRDDPRFQAALIKLRVVAPSQ